MVAAAEAEMVVEEVVGNRLRDNNTVAPNNSMDSHNSSMMSMGSCSHSI